MIVAIINQENVQVKNNSTWYKICPFPIGYIYMGYTSTSPATTFGGTWSSITGGKYFRAAAANNSAGTNSLSEKQMPSHSHELKFRTDNSASSNLTGQGYAGWESGGSEDRLYYGRYLQGRAITQFLDVSTERAGGGTPDAGEAFYPTYQNVYAWRRTA